MKGTGAELSEDVSNVGLVNCETVGEKKSPPKSGKSGADSVVLVERSGGTPFWEGSVGGGGGLAPDKSERGEVIGVQKKRSVIGYASKCMR
jgi:hypothetical protein